MSAARFHVLGLFLASCALAAEGSSSPSRHLSDQEKRGKQIYLRGVSASGKEITAYVGEPPIDVPGSVMACGNCHGQDGRGKPEGGVVPSDLTRQILTKSYGVTHENGRRHPPYDDGLMARAIVDGLDPAGNKLQPTMPRYRVAPSDLKDLVAYMRHIGEDLDPGITDDSITVATLVPTNGQLAATGVALRSVLSGYFDELNSRGGIYNRKIKLRVAECGPTAASTKEHLDHFLEQQGIFAMVGAFTAGADAELMSLILEKEVPLIGPSTIHPQTTYPLNRHVFYLFGGTKEESRALASFATRDLKMTGKKAAVVYPDLPSTRDAAESVEKEWAEAGSTDVVRLPYAAGSFDPKALAAELSRQGATTVLFLGSGHEQVLLAQEAGKLHWQPSLLLPGSQAGPETLTTPSSFQGRIYMSFPMRTSDQSPEGATQYRAFAARHNIGREHTAVAIAAYSGAQVLVEGLKQAGRELTREKLISALEGLYKFDTGLTPPITYGANRRVGAQGAYVVEVQIAKKNLAPIGGWIEVQ